MYFATLREKISTYLESIEFQKCLLLPNSISCKIMSQGGNIGPRYILQLLREKNRHIFGILRNFMVYAWAKFKNNPTLLTKLATPTNKLFSAIYPL